MYHPGVHLCQIMMLQRVWQVQEIAPDKKQSLLCPPLDLQSGHPSSIHCLPQFSDKTVLLLSSNLMASQSEDIWEHLLCGTKYI